MRDDITKVLWISNGSKDKFNAINGDYHLHVEYMNHNYWWWCVYFRGNVIAYDQPVAETKLQAKIYAESFYRDHKRKYSKIASEKSEHKIQAT